MKKKVFTFKVIMIVPVENKNYKLPKVDAKKFLEARLSPHNGIEFIVKE